MGPDWSVSDRTVIESCLKKVLASAVFEHSLRQQRMLSYLVNHAMTKKTVPIKGYTIGIEVFDRGQEFDPNIEPIVRVEASRLRNKLREYYESEGETDAVMLELPKGGYLINIVMRNHKTSHGHAAHLHHHLHDKHKLSFAVMPFAILGSGTEFESLADGITGSLISELSCLPGLSILSRQSSLAYKNSTKSAMEIGKELGVPYLIEGNVQSTSNRLRINVQWVETERGGNIWTDCYERLHGDLFDLQDDITRCIVSALQSRLTLSPYGNNHVHRDRAWTHITTMGFAEPDWRNALEFLDDARQFFLKAVEQDPSYAAAHALLARTLMFQWCMGWSESLGPLERALQHTHTAVALNGHRPYAHGVQEWVRQGNRCCREAIASCRQALAKNSSNTDAYLFLSLNLSSAGMAEEARYFLEKVCLPPPRTASPFYQFALGQCHFVAGDEGQARLALKHCGELCHAAITHDIYRATCYDLLGNKEEEAQTKRELQSTLIEDDGSMMIRFSARERRNSLDRIGPILDRRRRQHEDSTH